MAAEEGFTLKEGDRCVLSYGSSKSSEKDRKLEKDKKSEREDLHPFIGRQVYLVLAYGRVCTYKLTYGSSRKGNYLKKIRNSVEPANSDWGRPRTLMEI